MSTTTSYTVTSTTPQSTAYTTNALIFNTNFATAADTANSLNATSDYTNLITEIENTIKKNDVLFQQIQKSNYPNPGSYQSDLVNFKIDKQTKDITKTRGQIWDFINKKYTENTGLKKFYYDENRKADDFILQQTNDLSRMNALLSSSTMKDSTLSEQLKHNQYQVDKAIYYRVLYLVLVGCEIACVILLALRVADIFNGGLLISLLIVVITAIWSIYYIFFKNMSRSNMYWNKIEHDNNLTSQNNINPLLNNSGSNNNKIITNEKEKASIAVDVLVASEKASDSSKCST